MKHETMPAVVVKLMRGRDRLVDGHWCQGHYWICRPENLGGDLMCPVHAVDQDRAALAYLKAALPSGWFTVMTYADAPGRTLAEILALFDRAIALALQ